MTYLVDGNNIMGQRVGWHRDKPAARRRLIDELRQMAEHAETEIAVVFDAPTGKPSQQLGLLVVYYAKKQQTADDRIIDLAAQMRGVPDLVAVTSDRELARRLKEHGVAVMRSGVFRSRLDSFGFTLSGQGS